MTTGETEVTWTTAVQRSFSLLLMIFIVGCSTPAVEGDNVHHTSYTAIPAPSGCVQPTHHLDVDAEYYLQGPQQARPPDGTWPAGTRVCMVTAADSYSLVQDTSGVVAYVVTDALRAGSP